MLYDQNNVFARILRKEIPADIVYEDEVVLAFRDMSPAASVHVLVVPKMDVVSFHDFAAQATAEQVGQFFQQVRHVAQDVLALESSGYRLITNHGADASQTVPHFHVHILGGEPLGGLLASDRLVR